MKLLRTYNTLFLIIISFLCFLYPTDNIAREQSLKSKTYINPVIPVDAPDPTVLKGKDNYYYLFSTQSSGRVPIYKSNDLCNWKLIGGALNLNEVRKLLDQGVIWAPDVIPYKGKYLMAYSLSKWGEMENNGIGLAISDYPFGPYVNKRLLFRSNEINVKNSIDPSFYIHNKKLYLIWGSFNGIYIIEIKQKGDDFIIDYNTKIKLAGNIFEGSHIYKRREYYYLFASTGTCCKGDKSTYRVVVCRSKNLFGPYIDLEGNKMIDNNYNLVFKGNEKFVGPGHGSSIITDNDGKTWYLYHSYIKGKNKIGRVVLLDEIKWTKDGWPYFENYSPSCNNQPIPNL